MFYVLDEIDPNIIQNDKYYLPDCTASELFIKITNKTIFGKSRCIFILKFRSFNLKSFISNKINNAKGI